MCILCAACLIYVCACGKMCGMCDKFVCVLCMLFIYVVCLCLCGIYYCVHVYICDVCSFMQVSVYCMLCDISMYGCIYVLWVLLMHMNTSVCDVLWLTNYSWPDGEFCLESGCSVPDTVVSYLISSTDHSVSKRWLFLPLVHENHQ